MLGAVAFSGKAIIVKLAYRHGVDAVTLVMLRMLFALPLFLAMAVWASWGKPPLPSRDRWAIFGLGFCGYYLASFLDFAGLQYISASFERLILYLNPTLVLLLGWALFRKTVGRIQLWASAVSYAGIALVFGHELQVDGPNAATGAALVFASAISYAVYLVCSGELVKRMGSLRLVGWASTVACLLCIAQFLVLRPLGAAIVEVPVLWLSVLNATLCTVVPVLLVMLAIERIGAGLTAQVGMVGPLSTIAMGAALLGEPMNAWILSGTVLVMAGVFLVSRYGHR